jgi:AraC-like DNA-binding protein
MQLKKICLQINQETGAVVNVNTSLHPAFSNVEALKLSPNFTVHQGAFCVWARKNAGYPFCRANKIRSLEVAAHGKNFCGTCPWGIWEMAFPVKSPKRFQIVVYLGHFLLPGSTPKLLNEKRYTGALPPVLTPEKKSQLRHYGNFLAEFIRLELLSYTEESRHRTKHQSEEYYCAYCDNYIEENFSKNISLQDLADELKLNPNYLGGLLCRIKGKTFRQSLTEKRLYVASLHLTLHADINVSQIAENCGFCDSNYFCKVFSAHFGISPLRFRKRQKTWRVKSAP